MEKLAKKIDPKTIEAIKLGSIAVAVALAGAFVVSTVLTKIVVELASAKIANG